MCEMHSSYCIARIGDGFHVTYSIQAQKVRLDDTPAGECFVLSLRLLLKKSPNGSQFGNMCERSMHLAIAKTRIQVVNSSRLFAFSRLYFRISLDCM